MTPGVVEEGGKVHLSHRERFEENVAKTFKPGTRLMFTAEKDTRKLRQNNLYWLWVGIIETEYGWDPEYTHNWNKEQFNMKTVLNANQTTGELEEVKTPGDTHAMSVDSFEEFMERVQRGWAERGINLPSSNDEVYP